MTKFPLGIGFRDHAWNRPHSGKNRFRVFHSNQLLHQIGIDRRRRFQMRSKPSAGLDNRFPLRHFFETRGSTGDAISTQTSASKWNSRIGRGCNDIVDHNGSGINLFCKILTRCWRPED